MPGRDCPAFLYSVSFRLYFLSHRRTGTDEDKSLNIVCLFHMDTHDPRAGESHHFPFKYIVLFLQIWKKIIGR